MRSDGAASARALDPETRLQHALELAFRYLGLRDRTVAEMRRQLEAKGIEQPTVVQALASLHDQGYLDDARFAQRFAEDRRLLDAWGSDRIERRLTALGIDAEIARVAVASRDRAGELAAAVELLQRRFPQLGEDPRDRRRAFEQLVRKGYDSDLAGDALRAQARDQLD